jgi:hypothetical protein
VRGGGQGPGSRGAEGVTPGAKAFPGRLKEGGEIEALGTPPHISNGSGVLFGRGRVANSLATCLTWLGSACDGKKHFVILSAVAVL